MDETVAQDSSIKWTVYYEDEKKFDYSVNQLIEDLDYLKKWFAWHKAWAHKDGKPVIFIWNESDCQVADRWTTAAKAAGWYVVLKLFRKYDDCSAQPDSWHQYVSIYFVLFLSTIWSYQILIIIFDFEFMYSLSLVLRCALLGSCKYLPRISVLVYYWTRILEVRYGST